MQTGLASVSLQAALNFNQRARRQYSLIPSSPYKPFLSPVLVLLLYHNQVGSVCEG